MSQTCVGRGELKTQGGFPLRQWSADVGLHCGGQHPGQLGCHSGATGFPLSMLGSTWSKIRGHRSGAFTGVETGPGLDRNVSSETDAIAVQTVRKRQKQCRMRPGLEWTDRLVGACSRDRDTKRNDGRQQRKYSRQRAAFLQSALTGSGSEAV